MNDSIFRGNCQQAKALNAISDGIESLCETEIGGEGEPTKKTFPVRSQLTWFRLVHKFGSIRTKKIMSDDEQAEFEAEVFDEQGRFLYNAHGTATYADDGIHGFKLIETAESRAVARALSGAGFGCQLNLGYFNESEPGGPEGSKRVKQNELSLDNGSDMSANNSAGNKNTPPSGTINGQMRVTGVNTVTEEVNEPDAPTEPSKSTTPKLTVVQNTPAEKAQTTEKSEQLAGKNAKNKAKNATVAKPAADAQKASDKGGNTSENSEPAQKDTPAKTDSDKTEETDAAAKNDEVNENPADTADSEKGDDNVTPAKLSPAEKLAANDVYQNVKKQFDEVKDDPTEIKNDYFSADDVSDNGKYINRQKSPTHMDAMELQHAITVLEANKDSYKQIPAPLHENSERYGMTFGELMQDPTGTGKNLIAALSEMYRKDNALAFAAALICTKVNNLVLVESPAA